MRPPACGWGDPCVASVIRSVSVVVSLLARHATDAEITSPGVVLPGAQLEAAVKRAVLLAVSSRGSLRCDRVVALHG